MGLIRIPLRLSEGERAAVEELRGDRGLNTCLRRAVQQWCVRERALQETVVLGLHQSRSVRVAPDAPAPAKNGGNRSARADHPETQVLGAPPEFDEPLLPEPDDDEPGMEPEPEVEEPRRRRPPASAETWGAPTRE